MIKVDPHPPPSMCSFSWSSRSSWPPRWLVHRLPQAGVPLLQLLVGPWSGTSSSPIRRSRAKPRLLTSEPKSNPSRTCSLMRFRTSCRDCTSSIRTQLCWWSRHLSPRSTNPLLPHSPWGGRACLLGSPGDSRHPPHSPPVVCSNSRWPQQTVVAHIIIRCNTAPLTIPTPVLRRVARARRAAS